MKYISLLAMFVTLGVVGNAQDARPMPQVRPIISSDAKIVSEITSSSTIKNSPFSADAISESVQTLADGNRIVRSSTSKLYRNSEGRFRREAPGGTGGMLGSLYTYGQGITLFDPVGGFRYMIDPNLKTTRQWTVRPDTGIKVINETGKSLEGVIAAGKVDGEIRTTTEGGKVSTIMSDKIKEEIRATVAAAPAAVARAVTGQVMTSVLDGVGTMTFSMGNGQNPKWETRTEELGVQNIEGVDAEGTRTITTIPAGAIGNERPIEITYEKWYSRELQLVVMSKHNDPRFGEQTYRLTNIVRAEPDPSLFTPPQGYKLITEPSHGTYTISAKNAAMIEKAAAKAAQAAAAVTKTKP